MSTRAGILRFLGYAFLVALVSGLAVLITMRLPASGGIPVRAGVTAVQLALLVACALIFGWVALRDRLRRPIALAFVAHAQSFGRCAVQHRQCRCNPTGDHRDHR